MATWEEIKNANKLLKSEPIKGKDYVQVNQRVKAFRSIYPEGTINTEIVSLADGVVTMQAKVFDGSKLLASGYAQEKETSSYINKTSYIENCETSAVGRALGFCGLGIDTSIASVEEMQNAVQQQEAETEITSLERQAMINTLKACGFTDFSRIPEKVTKAQYTEWIEKAKRMKNEGKSKGRE